MPESVMLVCPHCEAINRVPGGRLGDRPTCGKCKRQLFDGHPVALTDASFDRQLTRNELPLVVDFWAPWCGPCKMMAPWFEQAAQSLEPGMRLVKVNTESEPQLGSRFAIRSIPTLALFRNGREVARQAGAMSAADIVRWAQAQA